MYYTCNNSKIGKEVYTDTGISTENFFSLSLKGLTRWHFYYLGKSIRVLVMGYILDNLICGSVLGTRLWCLNPSCVIVWQLSVAWGKMALIESDFFYTVSNITQLCVPSQKMLQYVISKTLENEMCAYH